LERVGTRLQRCDATLSTVQPAELTRWISLMGGLRDLSRWGGRPKQMNALGTTYLAFYNGLLTQGLPSG
jgi:hypothetical protein